MIYEQKKVKSLKLGRTNLTWDRYCFSASELGSLEAARHERVVSGAPGLYLFYQTGESKQFYIGESNHPFQRLKSHRYGLLRDQHEVIVYKSLQFSKSSIQDIESGLIRMMDAYVSQSAEAKLLNLKISEEEKVVDNYFLKGFYQDLDSEIWTEWYNIGLVNKSSNLVKISNRFELSPRMLLNVDQKIILDNVMAGWEKQKLTVVKGFSGTGKSVLASVLFEKLIENTTVYLTSGTKSTEIRFKEIFKKEILESKTHSMVFSIHELLTSKIYSNNLLIIDESHRLVKKGNQSGAATFTPIPKGSNVLEELCKKFSHLIIFYDENQNVHPSDFNAQNFFEVMKPLTLNLAKQARMSEGASEYIYRLLNFFDKQEIIRSKYTGEYPVKVFDNFSVFFSYVQMKSRDFMTKGPVALLAGYAWPWNSIKDKKVSDINIDGYKFNWNKRSAKNWLRSKNALQFKEIGYYNIVQGLDMQYAGVVIGYDLVWKDNCLQADDNFVVDRRERPIQKVFGRPGTTSYQNELLRMVCNRYKILLTRAIKGTSIYVMDERLRDVFKVIFS